MRARVYDIETTASASIKQTDGGGHLELVPCVDLLRLCMKQFDVCLTMCMSCNDQQHWRPCSVEYPTLHGTSVLWPRHLALAPAWLLSCNPCCYTTNIHRPRGLGSIVNRGTPNIGIATKHKPKDQRGGKGKAWKGIIEKKEGEAKEKFGRKGTYEVQERGEEKGETGHGEERGGKREREREREEEEEEEYERESGEREEREERGEERT